jgi:hypothetical protein
MTVGVKSATAGKHKKDIKIHYGVNRETICNMHKRRAASQPALEVTLRKDYVTCELCRSTFADKKK